MKEPRAGETAFVALGSNLGDRRAHLERAVVALGDVTGTRVVRVSRWIETAPVGGPPGQPAFLNGVLELSSRLEPSTLLERLQEIEAHHGRGRDREPRHGPRTLDLDLLLFGERRLESARLTLPHPRLEERLFVLGPLAELAPELVLPCSGLTVRARVAELARAPAGAAR
ncbi:MAG: 2-amino-4-hydroxy-6-hydroxymethyldihydropteridine diphosphokinase [Planctomycetes bacterium]|nr:2-amino-4-hydroxy-6-hydroxymethyldihydropteridine diphosphokinase [Planctomycetota bacterium]MDP6408976.1 2-amino-4-hydroxy-6-hydroxymethyldihydropteridine diphosphokinase [Planctomycetota bacterium]